MYNLGNYFRGIPTLGHLLPGGDSLESSVHVLLPSLYIPVCLTATWWLCFPDGHSSQDKQSQSPGARWFLDTPGPVPHSPKCLEPSTLSKKQCCPDPFSWSHTALHVTKDPWTCFWILDFTRCFGLSFHWEMPLKYTQLPTFATQEKNPHETAFISHSPALALETQ